MRNAILTCLNPVEEFWQLGNLFLANDNFVLIGWQVFPSPFDEGMPETVGKILTQVMISFGNVLFLNSNTSADTENEWKYYDDKATLFLKEPNPLKRFMGTLSGRSEDLTLLATRKPQTVERLFDDGKYPWWLQGQIVFVSDQEQILPRIDRETLLCFFEDDWLQQVGRLQDLNIECVLRPGVDGDVAGILFLTEDFRHTFLEVLESQSRAAGFDWEVLPESDFASSLADSHK